MRNTLGGELVRRFFNYYLDPWRKFGVLKGRSTRPEYWAFTLVTMLLAVGAYAADVSLGLVDSVDETGPIAWLLVIVTFIPSVSVTVRRLHDGNRSGWWILAHGIPLIGWMIWLFQTLAGGTYGENRFGPDPRGRGLVELPEDGGPPFATPKSARFVRCPWCGQTNPVGRASCQWCHKPYREIEPMAAPA